ncbi:MAG: alpha-mannosidase [Candidatus Aminicenantes bacterium]|nr:alpha-mannosidase [Candidatus Aminicenantes bacterium]
MMRYKHFCLIIIFSIVFFPVFAEEENSVTQKISLIEKAGDLGIHRWEYSAQDIKQEDLAELDETGWVEKATGDSIREKVFWLRQKVTLPDFLFMNDSGEKTVTLSLKFRGLGVFKGRYYCNGKEMETLDLKFGNQSSEVEQKFPLREKALPGSIILIAFRLENMGKLPLVGRNTVEPGTYFQIQEARFETADIEEMDHLFSRFVLDLKTGKALLDLSPEENVPSYKKRPISPVYRDYVSSMPFKELQRIFQEALAAFDPDVIRPGKASSLKTAVSRFYKKVKPVSKMAEEYTFYLTGNSHIDLAWLWRWRETVEVAKETFSTILDNMEDYQDIVYAQSQAQAYKWMEEYYPEVFERIKKMVARGRWEIVGGMWAEPDCNLIDGESFIRQILYGKKYFLEKFGVDVRTGWNPDSFGYNWNMPQFFTKSGFNSFITQKISWNDTTVFPYFLFQWEGVDGSRILTYFPPTGYVGRIRAERINPGLKNFERNTGMKDVLILYGLGNHGGGPNREMLDRAKQYKQQNIFPRMKHSSASEYLEHIRKKTENSLPVWKDELYLEYHRGTFTTQAETKKFNRKSEVLLGNTEKISSLAYFLGNPYDSEELKSAWEKVLMNQFHDILPGSSITPVYRDARLSYKEAMSSTGNVLEKSLDFLSQQVDTTAGGNGTPLLVFNTLSWNRDGLVQTSLLQDPPNVRVLDPSGHEVASQIINEKGRKDISFIAEDVPAMGYKVYTLEKASPAELSSSLQAGPNSLENRYFKVTLHPESGNICSIFDKIHKKEILAPEAAGNQLQLFEDIPSYWDAWNIGYTGRQWMLDKADSIEPGAKGPVKISLVVKKSFLGLSKSRRDPTSSFPSSFFSQEIILWKDIPRIDIRMEVDWWEDHVLLKVAFPVDIRSGKATYEIPFAAIERPTGRNTPWEKARFEVPAIRWADLSHSGYGISLLNDSKYGHDIKDNIIRLTLLRSPSNPDPVADRGRHEFSYALYPHKGDWKTAGTVLKGYEFNVPLLSLQIKSSKGTMPPEFSFLRADPANIICAAIKKAEDRDTVILRLYESRGEKTKASLSVLGHPKKIYELNLMEKRKGAVSNNGTIMNLTFGPFEIKTIELEYGERPWR